MKRVALSFVVLVCLAGCSPLVITVPKTEIIDLVVASDDYIGSYIQILNDEIRIDREIEVYWLDQGSSYWGMLIDVDIQIADSGGEMLIYDNLKYYLGDKIRVIVTWYEEEQHGEEE